LQHEIALVSAINGKDDGAFLSFDRDGYHYSVLDARDLSVLVEKPGLAKLDLVEVAKDVLSYDSCCNIYRTQIVPLETHVIDVDRSYGKLPTMLNPYRSWFAKPIEWCRDKDAILFVFQKELDEPASKVPYPAWKVDGGLRYDDERAIRRFVNPNADQLSNEYRDAKPRKILKTNEIIGTISFVRQAQP
jgi:hypothetical protein